MGMTENVRVSESASLLYTSQYPLFSLYQNVTCLKYAVIYINIFSESLTMTEILYDPLRDKGIEENIGYRDTRYEVYDWYGRYMGNDIKSLNNGGLYLIRYNNGTSEKVFIQ